MPWVPHTAEHARHVEASVTLCLTEAQYDATPGRGLQASLSWGTVLSMAHADATKSITFQVHDTEGQAYDVLLRVVEQTASGTLVITPEAGKPQPYAFTQMQKRRDGKALTCHASAATVTLTI